MWDATDSKQSYQAFTEHIRRQANGMIDIKSKVKRSGTASLTQENAQKPNEYPDDVQEEMHAVLQRRGFVPRPRGDRPPRRVERLTRPESARRGAQTAALRSTASRIAPSRRSTSKTALATSAASQDTWREIAAAAGLPEQVHLPGPRVRCRLPGRG